LIGTPIIGIAWSQIKVTNLLLRVVRHGDTDGGSTITPGHGEKHNAYRSNGDDNDERQP